ncbi:DUF6379 domain-containing protein [Actinomadura fulvescens]|uniref:C-deglycosylation enzyme beta subunit n=1 Tax=Actinomadura fulvescens TaxID=46160 RepID=A0ABP6CWT7_9ACTN
MFRERIIVDGSLAVTATGYRVAVRLPWYRALPVSSIEQLDIGLDGVPAPAHAITIDINGHQRSLQDAAEDWDEVWYVLDDAIVRVEAPRTPFSGDRHEIEVTLGVRIPYLPVAGRPLIMTERCVKTMPALQQAPEPVVAPASAFEPSKETAK